MQNEPKLDKPGAGLPFFEWMVAKFVIFPVRFSTVSNQKALLDFEEVSGSIETIVRNLKTEDLSKRKLIRRLQGLEDSSRYWSIAMTLEHLVIVGESMQKVIESLAAGNSKIPPTSIAEVKPGLAPDEDSIIEKFSCMHKEFASRVRLLDLNEFPQAKYAHPWFGPLNASQWLSFAAPHTRIHKKQIIEISKQL